MQRTNGKAGHQVISVNVQEHGGAVYGFTNQGYNWTVLITVIFNLKLPENKTLNSISGPMK
jgi:hypothetical protein